MFPKSGFDFENIWFMGMENGSVGKRTSCLCTGPKFNFPHPNGDPKLSIIPVLGQQKTPFSDLLRHQTQTGGLSKNTHAYITK